MNITKESRIDVPPERAWELLAHGFGDIADWFSGVSASEALPGHADTEADVAAGRVCTTARGDLTEHITSRDDEARRLTFVIEGLPGVVLHAENTFSVKPLADGSSRLSFSVVMTLRPVASVLRVGCSGGRSTIPPIGSSPTSRCTRRPARSPMTRRTRSGARPEPPRDRTTTCSTRPASCPSCSP